MQIYNENGIEISFNSLKRKACKSKWKKALIGLGNFLKMNSPEETVFIHAYEGEVIDGLRLNGVSFKTKNGGGNYQVLSGEKTHLSFIMAAEMFLETFFDEPFIPLGWQSMIYEHGDWRLSLLEIMGYKEAIDREKEHQLQLLHERLHSKKEKHMGYYMDQGETVFKIKKENLPAALEAIRELHGKETIHDRENGFSWVDDDFYKKENIGDTLESWRWEPEFDKEGNIVNIQFSGEKLGDEEILFRQIAKFVEHGSLITMHGENSDWRWVFENGQMITKHRSNEYI